MLTIVTPVKNPVDINSFICGNQKFFTVFPLIVVDSGGGEPLKEFAKKYMKADVPFWEARKLGYTFVETPYTLNLDADVILPDGYIQEAVKLLGEKADAVSIFYEDVGHCQGALEFGVSIWKTKLLRYLYDFTMDKVADGRIVKVGSIAYSTLNNGWCECTYMWRKLKDAGGKLETLPYRAKHLQP
jgi:uncharacterized protein (DUF2237 family)